MGSVDQPRDENGRWASSGSMGNQPVMSHANQPSVHTRLSAAARDRIIRGKAIDQRHFPNRGPEATAATDLGRPQAGLTATPGRFQFPRSK